MWLMRCSRALTLVELLLVIAILGLAAALFLSTAGRGKAIVRSAVCRNNLRQWGVGLQLYAAEHEDYLPDEGSPTPRLGSTNRGWYVALPRSLGLPPYHEMPWRTNPRAMPGPGIFICPSNARRSTNNNLFHYCLNGHVDGTGRGDRPAKLSSIPNPERVVYLFDNGKRAAVAQQNNVHTNLHQNGAHFLFLDSHVAHFKNAAYWDFRRNRGRTNHPGLIWIP